jgi:hypothetical protein
MHVRHKFSNKDDQQLTNLVQSVGNDNWDYVAKHMNGEFSARQCRERWRNYLNPQSGTTIWNDDMDNRLLEMHQHFGSNWELITKNFPGCSINTVRNRLFVLQRKLNKNYTKIGMKSNNEMNHIPNFSEMPKTKQHLDFKTFFTFVDSGNSPDISDEYFMPML